MPVLCVHGILDNCDSFSRLIPLLPKYFYYVCIDLPGHGQSSHFQEGLLLNVIMYVFAVKRVFNHFKWTKIYYLGHSLGGIIGMYFTGIFPENIEKIVSIDAFLTFPVKAEKTTTLLRENFMELLENEKRLNHSKLPSYSIDEAMVRIVNGRFTSITLQEAKCFVKRSLVETKAGGYRFTTDQRLKKSLRPLLTVKQIENFIENIRCPMLVIVASHKQNIKMLHDDKSEAYLKILSTLKNITFSEIDEDHDVHLTYPELIEPMITSFFLSEKSNL